MTAGCYQHQLVLSPRRHRDATLCHRALDQRHVQLVGQQPLHDLLRVRAGEADVDRGVLGNETAQQRRQQIGGDRGAGAEAKRAPPQLPERPHVFVRGSREPKGEAAGPGDSFEQAEQVEVGVYTSQQVSSVT